MRSQNITARRNAKFVSSRHNNVDNFERIVHKKSNSRIKKDEPKISGRRRAHSGVVDNSVLVAQIVPKLVPAADTHPLNLHRPSLQLQYLY